MGMYTGLRATVKVKAEYDSLIGYLHWLAPIEEQSRWERASILSRHDFSGWIAYSRCDFIPFGALCYMPDTFSDSGESYSTYKDRIWEFACSLKNYEGEIQFFVPNVLKVISEEIYRCESLYEEYPYPEHRPNPFEDHAHYLSHDDYRHWKQFAIDWTKP